MLVAGFSLQSFEAERSLETAGGSAECIGLATELASTDVLSAGPFVDAFGDDGVAVTIDTFDTTVL